MIFRSTLRLLLFLLVCSPLFGYAASVQLSQDSMKQIPNSMMQSIALYLKQIEEKSDHDELDTSFVIAQLHMRWPVENVLVYQNDNGFVFDVVLKSKIIKIQTQGFKLLNKKQLKRLLDLDESSYLSTQMLEFYENKIAQHYLQNGYLAAKVDLELLSLSEKGYMLKIHVQEGQLCKIQALNVEVSSKYNNQILKWFDAHDVHQSAPCSEVNIQKAIKKINKKMRKKNYYSFSLTNRSEHFSSDQYSGSYAFDFQLGPKYRFEFYGNTFAFERDANMLRALKYEDEKEFSQSWIKFNAVNGIQKSYAQKGYPHAKVTYEDWHSKKEDIRTMKFKIIRGKKVKIKKILFNGHHQIKLKELEKIFHQNADKLTRQGIYHEQELTDMVEVLLAYYQSKGFLNTTIDWPQISYSGSMDSVQVEYRIDEGLQTYLEGLEIHGNTTLTNMEIERVLKLKFKVPYNPILIKTKMDELKTFYQKRGFRYVQIKYPLIDEIDSQSYVLPITIDEGPLMKVGQIIVDHQITTKEKVVKRLIDIQEGELFDEQKVRDARRNLLQSGYFNGVEIKHFESLQGQNHEDLYFQLRERKRRTLLFRPGFSLDDGVRSAFELRFNNILGTGRQLYTTVQLNRRIQNNSTFERRLGVSFIEPYVLKGVQGRFSFFNERRDELQFDIDRTSLLLSLERRMGKRFRPSVHWNLEYRNPFNVQDSAVLNPVDETAARFGSVGVSIDFDYRDNILNPFKGLFSRLQYEYYDQAFLSESEFSKIYVQNTLYFPFYKRFRSILALRFGFSKSHGDSASANEKSIPIEKRFRLGGSSSFRGLSLNCIGGLSSTIPENCGSSFQAPGGNSVFNYMYEVLVPLIGQVDLAFFTDGGNAYASSEDFDVFNIRNSAGLGLRMNTFFGPLRLDYGVVLDRRDGEPFGTIHFSIGQF